MAICAKKAYTLSLAEDSVCIPQAKVQARAFLFHLPQVKQTSKDCLFPIYLLRRPSRLRMIDRHDDGRRCEITDLHERGAVGVAPDGEL